MDKSQTQLDNTCLLIDDIQDRAKKIHKFRTAALDNRSLHQSEIKVVKNRSGGRYLFKLQWSTFHEKFLKNVTCAAAVTTTGEKIQLRTVLWKTVWVITAFGLKLCGTQRLIITMIRRKEKYNKLWIQEGHLI